MPFQQILINTTVGPIHFIFFYRTNDNNMYLIFYSQGWCEIGFDVLVDGRS